MTEAEFEQVLRESRRLWGYGFEFGANRGAGRASYVDELLRLAARSQRHIDTAAIEREVDRHIERIGGERMTPFERLLRRRR